LSTVLTNIIESGSFEELFEQHRYALSQIERLTPQGLTIIKDYQEWPSIRLGVVVSQGPKVSSDFHEEFTRAYCQIRNVTDTNKYKRVQHSVIELQRQGLMEAYKSENSQIKCTLTDIGRDLLVYLK
jgi:predicted transcriptional regulator